MVNITVDEIPNSAQSTAVAGSGGNGDSDSGGDVTSHLQQQQPSFTSRQIMISTGEALCFG